MKNPFDVDFIIVLRCNYANQKIASLIPGSIRLMSNCGHEAFFDPDTVKFMSENEIGMVAYTMCNECWLQSERVGREETPSLVPGVRESVKSLIGVDLSKFFRN